VKLTTHLQLVTSRKHGSIHPLSLRLHFLPFTFRVVAFSYLRDISPNQWPQSAARTAVTSVWGFKSSSHVLNAWSLIKHGEGFIYLLAVKLKSLSM
jgi:hypothetical protein